MVHSHQPLTESKPMAAKKKSAKKKSTTKTISLTISGANWSKLLKWSGDKEAKALTLAKKAFAAGMKSASAEQKAWTVKWPKAAK